LVEEHRTPPAGLSADDLRRWTEGVSAFDTAEQAVDIALLKDKSFVAEVALPHEGIAVERKGSRGHYTLYGDRAAMVEAVITTRAISEMDQ
jgi:hypothetical protein